MKVNGIEKPILHSFNLKKPPGYKIICSPERIHYKKTKTLLDKITIYLEDKRDIEVTFNGGIKPTTRLRIKI